MTVARARQLERCVPEWMNYKTMLYVGARVKRMQLVKSFVAWDYEIDALEAYMPNFAELVLWNQEHHWFRRIINGDILNINELSIEREYDVVMWYHGPEHLEKDALPDMLTTLEEYAGRLVILGCPWGRYVQGPAYGNPHEVHRSTLYPPFFVQHGYSVDTIGIKDRRGSNLLAWKKR